MSKARKIVPINVTYGVTIVIDKRVLLEDTLHLINKDRPALPDEIDAELPYKAVGNIYREGRKPKWQAQWYQCGSSGCYYHGQGVKAIRHHVQRKHPELLTAAEYEAWRDKGLDRVDCTECGDPVPKKHMRTHVCKE